MGEKENGRREKKNGRRLVKRKKGEVKSDLVGR
jgi:hypothetical protein